MSPDQEDRFVNRILEWYDSNGRHDLPWRAPDASPFEVLVAELMLQQTSVEQVMNVYPEFVERYQTPDAVVDTAETGHTTETACRSSYLVVSSTSSTTVSVVWTSNSSRTVSRMSPEASERRALGSATIMQRHRSASSSPCSRIAFEAWTASASCRPMNSFSTSKLIRSSR